MSTPRVVTETRTVEWKPFGQPRACMCGHEHYARKEVINKRENLGGYVSWGICEDAGCHCRALRPLTTQEDA